ncbi:MAG TPA: protein phosphatase 2C domain-containing protein [Mycobacteriales bacterium]|nr:protein phosphatase 2C domain-containing protein [Mycobacteriales bacterium]
MSPVLRFGARSDVGLVRHNNQDSMYAGPRLIAVADGVGGAAGGEVASAVTITAITALDSPSITDPQAALRDAAEQADTSIRETIARDPRLAGMSTTLTAIVATDGELTLGHIGDSRAYRLRDGQLTQLSHDHTLVQSLVDEGEITEEEALTHPRRSWITRSLDGRGQPELDLVTLDLQPGDRLLVCSDGLSGYVGEADMTSALAAPDPQDAAERLTDLALAAGAPDNVTCIVADPVDGEQIDQAPIIGGAVADERPAVDLDEHPIPVGDEVSGGRESDEPSGHRRSVGRRLAAVAAVVVLLVAAAVAGVAVYVHHQWYVANAGGQVAVYQGVQGSAAGIQLSHLRVRTNLPVSALPQADRDRISGGIQTSGKSDANQVVSNLRSQACALATPLPTPATTPSARGKHHKRRVVTGPHLIPAWCSGVQQ